MRKEQSTHHDPLKKWITEAGIDAPGDGFHLEVLKKIEALPQAKPVYESVIAPWAWYLIVGLIASIVTASSWLPPAPAGPYSYADTLWRVKLDIPSSILPSLAFPALELSPPFVMGILAFSILAFLTTVRVMYQRHSQL